MMVEKWHFTQLAKTNRSPRSCVLSIAPGRSPRWCPRRRCACPHFHWREWSHLRRMPRRWSPSDVPWTPPSPADLAVNSSVQSVQHETSTFYSYPLIVFGSIWTDGCTRKHTHMWYIRLTWVNRVSILSKKNQLQGNGLFLPSFDRLV